MFDRVLTQQFKRSQSFAVTNQKAKVAELVDAQDLGSCGATRESSSLSFRTRYIKKENHYASASRSERRFKQTTND